MTVTAAQAKPSNARTAEVYQAAAELMVNKGFGGTSIADIAKVVGMTKAGLYHHIASKQDMLYQILQHAMEELERTVIEPAKKLPDPDERLREIIRLHVLCLFEKGLDFTLLFPERRHLEPAQQKVINQQVERYLGLMRETMQELADEGKLRDLDIHIAAKHTLQTIAGIARWHTKDAGVSEARLVEQTVNYNMSAILRDT